MAGGVDLFACPSCSKTYKWKADIAGKKVRCTACNLKLRVPASGGGKAEALEPLPKTKTGGRDKPAAKPSKPTPKGGDDESYELNLGDDLTGLAPRGPVAPVPLSGGTAAAGGDGKCPSCNQKVKPGAVICISCGFNLQAGKKLKTKVEADAEEPAAAPGKPAPGGAAPPAGGAPALGGYSAAFVGKKLDHDAIAADLEREHRFKEKVLPGILLGVGVVLMLINALVLGPMALEASGWAAMSGPSPVVYTSFREILRLIFQLPTLVIAVFVVASLFGTSFGPMFIALFKILALAAVAGATDQAVGYGLDILTGGWGAMVGGLFQWSIAVAVFWMLAMAMLETDVLETLVLWLITTFVPVLALLFLAPVIASFIF